MPISHADNKTLHTALCTLAHSTPSRHRLERSELLELIQPASSKGVAGRCRCEGFARSLRTHTSTTRTPTTTHTSTPPFSPCCCCSVFLYTPSTLPSAREYTHSPGLTLTPDPLLPPSGHAASLLTQQLLIPCARSIHNITAFSLNLQCGFLSHQWINPKSTPASTEHNSTIIYLSSAWTRWSTYAVGGLPDAIMTSLNGFGGPGFLLFLSKSVPANHATSLWVRILDP